MAAAGYRSTLRHDSAQDRGFTARCELFAGGHKPVFLSRLDFDLGNQELYLLNHMDLLFTIYKAKDTFLLQNLAPGDTSRFRVYIHSAKLYVKMIDVQPSLNMAIYSQLEKQPAKYAVRKTEIKSCFLNAGRTEVEHNVFSSAIPRRLTIALVANRAFNGDLTLSPFNFKHFNIRELSVHAGGQIYPPIPYNMNFESQNYARPFVDAYESLGLANSDRSCDISWDQFGSGWTMFVIPMTSTLDDSCGFELIRSGTTSVRMQFSEPIPAGGVEMIVLGEFDQMILIDFNRRVLTDSTIS
jgi:hypothetical protein